MPGFADAFQPVGQPNDAKLPRTQHREPCSEPRVAVIRALDDLKDLAPDWLQLAAGSPGVSAFGTPTAVLAWYRKGERPGGIYTIAAWCGGKLVGLMPLSVTHVGPCRVVTTAGAELGFSGEPVLADDRGAADAIAHHLSEVATTGASVVKLRKLWASGPMASALRERSDLDCRWSEPDSQSFVRFDHMADPEEYLRKVGRKHSVPRRTRRLAEHLGPVEFVPDDPEPESALTAMDDMRRRRLASADGTRATAQHLQQRAALKRSLLDELRAAGHARVSSLMAGDRRVVVSTTLRLNSREIAYRVAREPHLTDFGIGNIELYEYLRHAYEVGVVEVNLGPAKFEYKRRWVNDVADRQNVSITAPGLRGKVARATNRAPRRRRARQLRLSVAQ